MKPKITATEYFIIRSVEPHGTSSEISRRLEREYKIKISRPTIIKYLDDLIKRGYVFSFKIGNRLHYRLNPDEKNKREMVGYISLIYSGEFDKIFSK